MKQYLFIVFLLFPFFKLFAQDSLLRGNLEMPARDQDTLNQYGLYIISDIEKLKNSIALDSNKSFVHIKEYIPNIVLDIKYATTQNVFYEKLYDKPYALTRLPVAKALRAVQQELKQYGAGLKIYDAYRSYSVTCRMWDLMPDSIYMGKPWRGSRHNRGIALDLTLVDLKTKKELRMPTPYDALIYPAHQNFMGLPDSVIKNRALLTTTMQKHGFAVDQLEWWHFNYVEGLNYELLDIPFAYIEKLIRKNKKRN